MKLPQLRTCALSLLTLLVAAPASPSPHARMPATTRARTSAASTPNASQGQLRCTPRRLQRGDTLTLDMPAQHGGYLAVVNPRGKYFFLTSGDAGAGAVEKSAGVNPFISTAEFGGMRQLQLSTTDTKAVDYGSSNGTRRAETVFRQTGWYKVLISEQSFERDEPSPDGLCRIYYVNKSRKGR